MSYIKAMCFTIVVALGIGWILAYMQDGKVYETSVEIRDKISGEYIKKFELKTYPSLELKYNEAVTGRGKKIFNTEIYSVGFYTVKSKGYKKNYGFFRWDATQSNVIYLEKEEGVKEKVKEKTSKEKKVKENKVNLLPEFKK